MDIIRDSSLGQLIRYLTKNKVLLYEEDSPSFSCPKCYDNSETSSQEKLPTNAATTASSSAPSAVLVTEVGKEDVPAAEEGEVRSRLAMSKAVDRDIESGYEHLTMWKVPTQAEIQRTCTEQGRVERAVSRPIEAVKTADGTILVVWYTTGKMKNILV